jgi:hypothetical protein
MDISKTIRRNKQYVKEAPEEHIRNNKSVTPIQDNIVIFVRDNPNCVMSDIYKEFPNIDEGGVRRAMRRLIESHRVIQRFTVGNVPL